MKEATLHREAKRPAKNRGSETKVENMEEVHVWGLQRRWDLKGHFRARVEHT